MRARALKSLLLIALFALGRQGWGEKASFPQPQGYVNDYSGALDASFKARLEGALEKLQARGGPEIAVVLLDSIAPQDINEYANDLFNAWHIGVKGKDNGLLVLLALKDHKLRIEVAYGLEGDIPDGWVGRLRDEVLVPKIRTGDLEDGLWLTCDALARKAGFGGLVAGVRQETRGRHLGSAWLIFLILFILIAVLNSQSRMRRGWWGGGGWGGGFGGDGWGGGGGGFGGFGGGSSGGGGASGSW